MGITTNGLSVCAACLAGSYGGDFYMGIGQSGLAFTSGNTSLAVEFDRNYVDSYDLGTSEQVTFITNWSPYEISGCILREYGILTLGSTLLNREVLTGSLVFDGEQELQIQHTIKFKIE